MTNMNETHAEQLYPSIPLAQTIVQFCAAKNIQHIVISPGSRNAPLTKGFTADPFFTTYSIVDERAAAFFALGIAQQIKQPVAVVCTSGSALLNYYPAVAEAFYSDLPLVVLSADRMPHRIDIGDGQTIRQTHVFEPHLEDAAYLTPDVSHATATLLAHPGQNLLPKAATKAEVEKRQAEIQNDNEKQINRVLNTALQCNGPVHLNIPFEEPLYDSSKQQLELKGNQPLVKEETSLDFAAFFQQWQQQKKKMILVGVMPPGGLSQDILDYLAADPSVTVLTETTSNLSHYTFIESIDSFIAPMEGNEKILETYQPDLLLTFGGMVVSKKIKAFLRRYAPQQHWHLDEKKAYDTYYCLNHHLNIPPSTFFKALMAQEQEYVQSDYCVSCLTQYNKQRLLGQAYIQQLPFSDFKAFDLIFKQLPAQWMLQLANSSTIRYAQLFSLPQLAGVYCNRGTSGIDGSTATAMGAAYVQQQPTLFITGDLSFFYDINGLWNNYLKATTRIIVINNQGGGIFRILPGEKDTPAYDTYFETVQRRSVKQLCKAFGLGYRSASSTLGLKWQLSSFFRPSNRPQVLEIKTPRKLNDQVLLNYFKAMQAD
ncbi:MAG: 2-succinyl-5-enolpyruvyl-6-hydroxy-3-cyclohexene-1-carboxylate synthase [Flavobacteriaceae bacterium]